MSISAFATTSWSLVAMAASGDDAQRRAAQEQLASRYLPAVEAYLRRRGYAPEFAAESAQAFFVDVVIGRQLFQAAERTRGRLRSLVLTALGRYLADLSRRNNSRLSAHRSAAAHGRSERAAERCFDQAWALGVVSQAIRECERHFSGSPAERNWRAFEDRILRPTMSHTSPPEYHEIAEKHGFAACPDAAAAVQYVRKRFLSIVRQFLAESPGETCTEADLLEMLGPA